MIKEEAEFSAVIKSSLKRKRDTEGENMFVQVMAERNHHPCFGMYLSLIFNYFESTKEKNSNIKSSEVNQCLWLT